LKPRRGTKTTLGKILDQFGKSRLQRVSFEIGWVVLGQVLTVVGTLVGVRLLTQRLSTEAYGEIALALTFAMLVNQVVMGPVSSASYRFYAIAHQANELGWFFASVRKLLFYGSLVVLGVGCLAGVGLYLAGYGVWIGLLAWTLLFSVASGYGATFDAIQSSARRRAVVTLHSAAFAWGRFISAIALIAVFGANSTIAMAGFALSALAVSFSQRCAITRVLESTIEPSTERSRKQEWGPRMISYGLPFSMWGIPTWAHLSSDRWALSLFGGPELTGLYAVAYQLGFYPVSIVANMASGFVTPIIFARASSGAESARTLAIRLTWITLAITALATTLVYITADWIVALLVAKEFHSAAIWIPGLVLAGGLFSAAQFASLGPLSEENSRKLLVPRITVAAFGIAGATGGAAVAGVWGVVVSLVIVNLLYLLWVLALAFYSGSIAPQSGQDFTKQSNAT